MKDKTERSCSSIAVYSVRHEMMIHEVIRLVLIVEGMQSSVNMSSSSHR